MQVKLVATVQLLLNETDPSAAADGISELLSHNDFIMDWSYLKVGGQYLKPQEAYVDEDYKEGGFLT